MEKQAYLETLGAQAKQASYALANLGAKEKQTLLTCVADHLRAQIPAILAANAEDVAAAKANGLTPAMVDRLLLDEDRLQGIIGDIETVIALADPVGSELESRLLENGMRLSRRVVPLGVLGVIYEARPNVTVDIAVLALKTGNAAILRGGKETLNSNRVLAKTIQEALVEQGLPANAIQLIEDPDRALVSGLLKLDNFVDMIIPRGGNGLQRLCAEQATIPVILGGIGICHMFVDQAADLSKIIPVIENAKVQRPTVCNALDTLLVHQAVAEQVIPEVVTQLSAQGVHFYGCPKTQLLAQGMHVDIQPADHESYRTEWLSLTLGIKVVDDIDEAVSHIRQYSSGHSEAILTDDMYAANKFLAEVDSAALYVNASTRFTDGAQFGLGAEVAVSTQKLHARGPMGLEALTTYKWLAWGDYTPRS